jgi:hypothetical protein
MTGSPLVGTIANEMIRRKARYGVVTAGRTFEESIEMLIQALRETPVRESLAPAAASL